MVPRSVQLVARRKVREGMLKDGQLRLAASDWLELHTETLRAVHVIIVLQYAADARCPQTDEVVSSAKYRTQKLSRAFELHKRTQWTTASAQGLQWSTAILRLAPTESGEGNVM
jgi:hypothetical protein